MKEKEYMSRKEAERLSVMKQVDKKILNLRKGAEELGISLRQVKRIRKRYIEQGGKGLISLKRGKTSNRKILQKIRDRAVELIKEKYHDFGPTLVAEKLERVHEIKISVETARKWLVEENLWKVKRKKEVKVYQRRIRRSRFGELLQGDGSPHDWFEGRGEKCTLLQFVDDATSQTTVARFFRTEGTEEYLELLKEHLEKWGRPQALYVDKHSTFRVNREEIQKGVGITHFGQVMKGLDIELICANSPQAKGRVERKNGLFQDRLIKEMRLKGISNIEEGNVFLPEFIKEMNQRFGKEACNSEDAHRALRQKDDLKRIFARKDERTLSKNLTFQHQGTLYLIQTKSPNRMRHARVEVIWQEGEPIEVEYKGVKLKYKKWEEKSYERPEVLDSKEIAVASWTSRKTSKPGKHHPWR